MKIVLDVFGGDYAPKEIVLGAVNAVKVDKDIEIVAVGDENKINEI